MSTETLPTGWACIEEGTDMTECPRADLAECPYCTALPGEDCVLTVSTHELLDRQKAVTAAATGFCNPSEGVCDSCQ